MIKKLALIAPLLITSVEAKPAYVDCVVQDGSRFYMAAVNGSVAIKWGDDGSWEQAFGKVDGSMVVITQLGEHGVVVVAWQTQNNSAYIVIKDDRTGKRSEYRARCWSK